VLANPLSYSDAAARRPHDGWAVETVTDTDGFIRLESEWNDAVDRAGVTYPFLRHEWLRTWWDCFGAGRHLHVIIIRSQGRIAGIAPLLRDTAPMYGVPIRQLQLMHNDHVPRADFIVAGHDEDVHRAIWKELMAQHNHWDVLKFSQIPQESKTLEALSLLAAEDGCATGVWESGSSPYLEITGTWDEYFRGLTGKFRQNVRNRVSRLRRLGEPTLEVVTSGSAVQYACDDVVRLEASGWKRNAGTAISSDAAVDRFYRHLAPRSVDAGWLALLFLSVNGVRIAASYALRYQRRLFLCKTGYDPDFAASSPFKVLASLALRWAFDEGFTEVDFLGDPEPWKLEWTTKTRSHRWLFIFGKSGRARILHPVKFRVVPALKRTLSLVKR